MNDEEINQINQFQKMSIGFIGLGSMGYPMVSRLLQAGYDVTVFDVRTEPMEKLHKELGAKMAHSIQDFSTDHDVFITMLQTGEQVRNICMGEQGIYQHAKKNAIHIDTSSIDIKTTRELHQAAEAAHLRSLDAPVSGGIVGAGNGQLTFAVGGDESTLNDVLPILNVMGKRIVHTGGPGNGQAAKICNNMILGISMIAVSEAFSLGEKLGLSPENFFEFSANASGQCWAMTSYCPVPGIVENTPANNQYKPGFAAQLMLKDLHLSQQAAKSVNLQTSLGKKAEELYQVFVDQHDEPIDFSAIIKMISNE
jgi:3-hydroxyisobutyrate dehydrogenase